MLRITRVPSYYGGRNSELAGSWMRGRGGLINECVSYTGTDRGNLLEIVGHRCRSGGSHFTRRTWWPER